MCPEQFGKDNNYLMRQYSFQHRDYHIEFDYYNLIIIGDVAGIKEGFTEFGGEGAGTLSKDPVQNIKYHFVITAALISRLCIENGMPKDVSFGLSDHYINLCDDCTDISSIEKLHFDMVVDYTKRMSQIAKTNACSKPVVQALDYIYDHLHEKFSAKDVAESVGITPEYLSKVFHAEVGMTMNRFITKCRIKSAKRMLLYTNMSAVDISTRLAFSSHSHFINTFKRHTQMTPHDFRKRYHNNDFQMLSQLDDSHVPEDDPEVASDEE